MNYELVLSENSKRLVLIFTGWGYELNRLGDQFPKGYDVMAVKDYSSFHIDWSCVNKYSEICLFAFSTGVYVASQTTQAIEHKITLRVAVNGTLHPVDNRLGIPENDFFSKIDSPNTPDSFRRENEAIYDRTILDTPSDLKWDYAVIGRGKDVFPRQNQIRAWQEENVEIQFFDESSGKCINRFINHFVVDKNKNVYVDDRKKYFQNAAVLMDIVERLMNSIRSNKIAHEITGAKNTVLEIGSGAGILSSRIAMLIDSARLLMWDVSADIPFGLPPGKQYAIRNCMPEIEITCLQPSTIDHIFSSSTVQWFNSPEKFLVDCKRALRSDGYLFLTTFTIGNLHEISDITGRRLPLLKVDKWIETASRHFEVVAYESFMRDLDFESPEEALEHLKSIGMDYGIDDYADVAKRYPMRLDGRYHITFNPLILILRKK